MMHDQIVAELTHMTEGRARTLFNRVKDATDWKRDTTPFYCNTEAEAIEMAAALCYFHGGFEHPVRLFDGTYVVKSMGYYAYMSA